MNAIKIKVAGASCSRPTRSVVQVGIRGSGRAVSPKPPWG